MGLYACISDGLLLYDNTDYTLLRCDKANRIKGGGVCAFIRKSFKFVLFKIPQEYALCEILCQIFLRTILNKDLYVLIDHHPQIDK